MITTELKKRIIEAVKNNLPNYKNAEKHAQALGVNSSQYSKIFTGGDVDYSLADAKWINIARRLGVQLKEETPWVTVKTETYEYVYSQLEACQTRSISAILCDLAGIGKTHTAKQYVKENRNAIYIDCSQVKSKQKLIRKIAQEFGIIYTGRYADVYEDLVFYIKQLEMPLVILDEAGDLDYPAFLELKALWNATEYACGWYMMGADGLREKINRQKNLNKVGYTEIFDRYGNDFKKVSPDVKEALEEFYLKQIAQVSKANHSTLTPKQMFAKTKGSLRKVRIEIEKQRLLNNG
ncbi:AAA family ATPase [Ornithobacterium rhinotracheale]|uniref:AAA family ATPase n=1 Tax=Ornithobacterium rhinotracheale TaxID=28251 RepID=UPI00129C3A7F|nr:AAA family ATPase [Ornithobacterium rhinotracheale]MRJ09423.1 ATP-binding protein [Ornithobacterium rhinotracheale]UOH77222.1 ATP-binding protein [Ornithobacterium rhinotracheale]UOH77340.1 ATP-binding protein [Ornithobacterium rhinotracheale]UOH77647.1 ATP-binding protein [Ornithobacterium rhinotracheale]